MASKRAGSASPLGAFRVAVLVTILLCLASAPSPADASWKDVKDAIKRWLEMEGKWNCWLNDLSASHGKRQSDVDLDHELSLAEKSQRVITVSQDGEGDFDTVTDALRSVPSGNKERVVIKIEPGTYHEKVVVDDQKPFVTLLGDPEYKPTITLRRKEDAVVKVEADYFMAANVIFESTHGAAMEIKGDKAAFLNCEFHGFRDTLFDAKGRHFFKECYIRGADDFIFGNGKSLYSNCTIKVIETPKDLEPIRERSPWKDSSGFSFVHCKVEDSEKVEWRPSSKMVFANSYLGVPIKPTGWTDDGHPAKSWVGIYGQYKCEGLGAVKEETENILNEQDAKPIFLNDGQAKAFASIGFIRGTTWILKPPSYDD